MYYTFHTCTVERMVLVDQHIKACNNSLFQWPITHSPNSNKRSGINLEWGLRNEILLAGKNKGTMRNHLYALLPWGWGNELLNCLYYYICKFYVNEADIKVYIDVNTNRAPGLTRLSMRKWVIIANRCVREYVLTLLIYYRAFNFNILFIYYRAFNFNILFIYYLAFNFNILPIHYQTFNINTLLIHYRSFIFNILYRNL